MSCTNNHTQMIDDHMFVIHLSDSRLCPSNFHIISFLRVFRGELSRGESSRGELSQFTGARCPGASCPGASCPDTDMTSDVTSYDISIIRLVYVRHIRLRHAGRKPHELRHDTPTTTSRYVNLTTCIMPHDALSVVMREYYR